jgi:hypothetical protein
MEGGVINFNDISSKTEMEGFCTAFTDSEVRIVVSRTSYH